MKIFVIGISGCIGRAVAQAFSNAGHSVSGLCKTKHSCDEMSELGFNAVLGDMVYPNGWLHHIDDVDVVVHAAHVRPGMRLSSGWLKRSSELRDRCLSEVVDRVAAKGCRQKIIYTSGMIAYGDHSDAIIDERTNPNASALGDYHRAGEDIINTAIRKGISAVSIRAGMVYGNAGTFKKFFLDVAKKGKYQYPGSGENYIPFIHLNDLARAYVKVAERDISESIISIVDDDPVKMKDMANHLLNALNGGKASKVPSWLVSVFAGVALSEMLTGSYRINNALAKRVLDWSPEYPNFAEGIISVAKEYQSEGTGMSPARA